MTFARIDMVSVDRASDPTPQEETMRDLEAQSAESADVRSETSAEAVELRYALEVIRDMPSEYDLLTNAVARAMHTIATQALIQDARSAQIADARGFYRKRPFRCSQCRLRGQRDGWAARVELTSRKRPHRGKAGVRNSHIDREYRCLDCGHVGWSCHIELAYKAGEHPDLLMKDGETYLPSWARGADRG